MRQRLLSLVVFGVLICCGQVWAGDGFDLQECFDDELNLHFLCHPDWQVQFNEASDLFVISEDPAVLLTFVREQTDLVSLQQITHAWLEDKGLYAPDFSVERVVIGNGIPAVKVKAFDRYDRDLRLADYYFLRGRYLYKILFSVVPEEAWEDYQFLLKDVMDGLRFMSDADLYSTSLTK